MGYGSCWVTILTARNWTVIENFFAMIGDKEDYCLILFIQSQYTIKHKVIITGGVVIVHHSLSILFW